MKTFLKKTILFSLLVLLLGLAIELSLLAVPNEYSYKRKYIEEHGDGIKVLVLGHSHAGNGINPEYLGDSVFNMAISGRNHRYDAVLARRYIPGMKNLKCVIWPLGYNFQYFSVIYPCTIRRGKEVNLTPSYQCMYEKYMGISYEPLIPYLHWSEILNSRMGYGTRIFKSDFEDKHQCTPTGYERMKLSDRTSSWKTDKLPSAIDYGSKNAELAFQEGLSDFLEIARTCHEAGVRLVVVTFPCYQSYLEQTTERGMEEMQQCVEAMQEVCPKMEYYNFIDDSRFEEDDFFNSSHLNEIGAKKFTLILKDCLDLE